MDILGSYDYQTIESMIRSFLWPFFRISGMLMSMVVIGSFIISRIKRAALAFTFTLVVSPILPAMPVVELISFEAFMISINQLIIGLAVGFVSRLIFETFIVGGQIIAMSSGLGFAIINDPSSGVQVPAVGQFFLMMATLIFLAIDGHLMMFELI
ncbi:MAG: flagellar biosynthetic protein FliR, partial [Enterobacterales bacterium]